jgi:hypothetical protein
MDLGQRSDTPGQHDVQGQVWVNTDKRSQHRGTATAGTLVKETYGDKQQNPVYPYFASLVTSIETEM